MMSTPKNSKILKLNKSNLDINSYRLISFLTCLLKTFERCIESRIEWWLHAENKIPPTKYWSTEYGVGTLDALADLMSDIQINFSRNNYLTTIIINRKLTYDNVNLEILESKLVENGILSPEVWNIDLFHSRKVYIRSQRIK